MIFSLKLNVTLVDGNVFSLRLYLISKPLLLIEMAVISSLG